MNEEKCVCCGTTIPEGRQVCPQCEEKYNLRIGDVIPQKIDRRCRELEDKHRNECGQIARYDDELRRMTRFLHCVRAYYRETISWDELFEAEFQELSGEDGENNA